MLEATLKSSDGSIADEGSSPYWIKIRNPNRKLEADCSKALRHETQKIHGIQASTRRENQH